MAPRKSSAPSSLVLSLGNGAQPAVAREAVEEVKHRCRFCKKRFGSRQALAGHHNLHRPVSNNPDATLLGLEQVRREALEYHYRLRDAVALLARARLARARPGDLSSAPTMAVPPPRAYPQPPHSGLDQLVNGLTALFEPVGPEFWERSAVAGAQGPGASPMPKEDDGAGPSSNAGAEAVDVAPPPGFGQVLPDLNCPAASSNMKPVKKEIIKID